uniref:BAALC binder of MAP3K1 and KLF4 b n=1 Tax=Anabas testudineus TaxID=64144 RepID=A0A3Q1IKA1_ANATE
MGCGGSRADAIIEPRYHESWTRETESTWLTNTDVETPLPVANSKIDHLQLLSKGKALESSLREKRMVNTGTQCGKQAVTTTGSNHQRRPRRSLTDVGVTVIVSLHTHGGEHGSISEYCSICVVRVELVQKCITV